MNNKRTSPRRPRKTGLKRRMDSALEYLRQTELVSLLPEEKFTYSFQHTLTQDAAYDSLLRNERRRLHRLVAQALERTYAQNLDAVAARLANHFGEADDTAKAFEYSMRAGDAALRISAIAEAYEYFNRAFLLAARLPDLSSVEVEHLYVARGRTFELSTRYTEALRNYEEMEAVAEERGDAHLVLQALIQHANLHAIPSPVQDLQEAEYLAHGALDRAQYIGDRRAEATIRRILMLINNFQGQLHRAVQYGEESLEIARGLDLREQVALTLNDLFRPYASIGEYERSGAAAEEAREIWRETGNLPMLADNLSRSARVAVALGDYSAALGYAAEAREISEQSGNLWGQSFCRMFIAYVHLDHGEFTTAIETMHECIRLGTESGFVLAQIATRADLGWFYGSLGAVERGLELAHEAFALAEAHVPTFRPWALASLGRLYVMQGDLVQAEEKVRQGYAAFVEDWAQNTAIELPIAAAELALARGEYTRAYALMRDLLQQVRARKIRTWRADALYLEATALWKMGQTDAAMETLQEAASEASTLGSRRMLWQIFVAMSDIESERGNAAQAQTLRAKAKEIVQSIADHITDDALRTSFLRLDTVRTVMG